MDEKQLKTLWDLNANDKGFTDYNEFKSLMQDPDARRVYFDDTNNELGFSNYDEFENLLIPKKATEVSGQGSQNTSGTSTEPYLASQNRENEELSAQLIGRYPIKTKLNVEEEKSFNDWYSKVSSYKGLSPD